MPQRFDRAMLSGGVQARIKRGDTSYGAHWHTYFEMVLYRGCVGVCAVNGVEYAVRDDSVFLVTPTDYHKIDNEPAEEGESLLVAFSEEIINREILDAGRVQPTVLYSPGEFVVSLFREINRLYEAGADSGKIACLINYILSELWERGEQIGEGREYFNPSVRRAVSYALSNLSNNLTLAEVSRQAGLSRTYFSDLFHKVMGKSFKTWLSEVRIEHAKRMLELGRGSVLEIAYECGFGSTSHYIKVFREVVGTTPNRYAKNARNKRSV